MPQIVHHIQVADGSVANLAQNDRVIFATGQKANSAGGGAGQSVSVSVSGLTLPANYQVLVNPNQDATAYVAQSSKSATGFTITLNPRLAANTLASGSVDWAVFA